MMRDDVQLAEVCNVLTARIRAKGIHWKGDGPDKGASRAALEAIEAVEARAAWARVLVGIRDVHSHTTMRDFEQSCSAVGFADDDHLTLVLQVEDAATLARMLGPPQKMLDAAMPHHGMGAVLFTIEQRGGPYLSSGESLMLRAAWALWNGRAALDLGTLVNTLDGENLALIGSLLVALSTGNAADIDRWLVEHTQAEGSADA